MTADGYAFLDLYSTSQTPFDFGPKISPSECDYHAPYFAYESEPKHYVVTQGCCNHWDCRRCGTIRAKQEYWRIVSGCDVLSQQGHALWFITITTRGQGLKVSDAERSYLQWTNRYLTNLRTDATRHGMHWCYVQVTERQKRRHPHSHILTTYDPRDAVEGFKVNYFTRSDGRRVKENVACLRSERLQRASVSAGLGEQYDVSRVDKHEAVSRYVGKYLFKSSILTVWPDGWRRVRYSQNWPKNEMPKTNAICLISRQDWYELATCADTVTTREQRAFEQVSGWLWAYPVKVRLK